jgi:alpha,alpha-trehalase
MPRICLDDLSTVSEVAERIAVETRRSEAALAKRKAGVAYPEVPSVAKLSICTYPPNLVAMRTLPLSAGLTDPILLRARDVSAFEDFKVISDYRPKPISEAERERLMGEAKAKAADIADPLERERATLKAFIDAAYEKPAELVSAKQYVPPKWKLESGNPAVDAAFAYTEETWGKLLQSTKPVEGGSLLGSPYPVLVPAGRFQEAYYWDSYFGMKGLLATGRLDVAQMQVENFLEYIRKYGFVPNGGRDYYLSRSQPPFLSSMVREVFDASMKEAKTEAEKAVLRKWLAERAYPLLKRDYEKFWMNPKTRFDPTTGLNHHWDDIDLPRPERHSADHELEIGKTYRDVRAGAESGLDFTDAFKGEPTKIAGPLLNSMLYKTEKDLEWIAGQIGEGGDRLKFGAAAKNRREAMNRYLWNPKKKRYAPYHLGRGRQVNVLSADGLAPLFVGAASPAQAAAAVQSAKAIERKGGLMASDLTKSHHQWDGANGWAPYQVMAIVGFERYGFHDDATRIAKKWVKAVTNSYEQGHAMFERVDVVTLSKPVVDEHKYPTQEGFLWTNGSFVWAAVDVLKMPMKALPTP